MKLYFKYLSMHMKSLMQYKASFIMTACGQFITSFSAFLTIYFMFDRFNSIEDFSYGEVLICFASVLTSFSLAECFARGFDSFGTLISNGMFDRIMVRPRGLILQVLGTKIELTRLGRLVQAVIIFIYAIPVSKIVWTVPRIMTLILMVAGGTVVFSSLFVAYAALCFFTLEGLEFVNIFTDGGREFGAYPFSVYGKAVLGFYTFVIPLALFQYYPLLFLTGRTDSILFALLPLVATLFVIPCILFWNMGVRHYKSTGS